MITPVPLVAAMVLSLAMPALTAHAFVGHVAAMEPLALTASHLAGVSVLGLLTVASVFPLVLLGAGVFEVFCASRRVAQLRMAGKRASAFGVAYIRLPGERPCLFTAGVWKPAIFATVAAESELAPEQFRAALLHEQAHRARGDVEVRMVLRIVERAFGWLPGVRSGCAALVLRSECEADRWAVRAGASRSHLFEAIVRSAGVDAPIPALGTAAPWSRARALVDPADIPGPLPRRGALSLLAWHAGPATLAHAIILFGIACTT